MTETELIMGSLTDEELDEAQRYVGFLSRSWRSMAKDEGRSAGFRTDAPFHATAALSAAVLRETAVRGGAEPWYAGMPTAEHPARLELDLYARRYAVRSLEAHQGPDGTIRRVCALCLEEKPQDERHFARTEGLWADICLLCSVPDHAIAAALVEQYPAPAPTTEQLLEAL